MEQKMPAWKGWFEFPSWVEGGQCTAMPPIIRSSFYFYRRIIFFIWLDLILEFFSNLIDSVMALSYLLVALWKRSLYTLSWPGHCDLLPSVFDCFAFNSTPSLSPDPH
ncbi:hypothetical protein DUI87_09099 [Hirundo rustica rustica]|uniref:Uncharacterized protein n=1 Tax=Hirundo rustica rustica TaxID=333673 RepID=A0A3M0KLT2_HIRRU|nr:hypothetical protein DUI87_09099 [Hirundo rustica rustica]